MATYDEAVEALTDAIVGLSEVSLTLGKKGGAPSATEAYASAARQLAEARAWLMFPAQPHGGAQGGSGRN